MTRIWRTLDPTAAIKIPGMSYQPPVLGTKELLNFHATSLPAPGGWIAFGVMVLGSEACQHCHMTVADDRFIAQLVTSTGKVLIYDDPGCLATALRDGVVEGDLVRSLWVTDYLDPATLLDADRAWFVQSDAVHTPMASGLVAVPSRTQADSLAAALSGTVVRWDAVRDASGHRH